MMKSYCDRCWVWCALAAGVLSPCWAAAGDDIDWINPGGGLFGTGANWDGGAVPGMFDTAVFDVDGGFTVGFDANHTTNQLLLHDGDVVFDLGGNTYDVTGAIFYNPSIQVGVGVGDSPSLRVTNGTLASVNTALGFDAGSYGSAVVDGATWTHTGEFNVGLFGSGELTIINGGSIDNVFDTFVGNAGAAVGTVHIIGEGSQWTTNTAFNVGVSGQGILTITDGGDVASDRAYIGRYDYDSVQGDVLITGEGSTWTNTSIFVVGGDEFLAGGDGNLTIGPGAVVHAGNEYLQYGGGMLEFVLVSADASGYGHLDVSGDMSLDGAFAVTLDGFSPAFGDSFDLFDFGDLSGTFSTISLPALDGGLDWDTTALYSDGVLSVVPAPATLALLGLGTCLAKRRRTSAQGA